MIIETGQVAVITGAGSGIGAALARACAARGMRVLAADIDREAAEATAASLRHHGADALAACVDVTRRDAIDDLATSCWQHFGDCHLLCNNAGVSLRKPLIDCNAADWQRVLAVNLMGTAHAVAAFVPRMRTGGIGHIVNTASMAGLAPLAGFGPYVGSKYALVGLSEVLAQELVGTGIGLSILCPGMVDTHIQLAEQNHPAIVTEPATTLAADPEPKMESPFEPAYSRCLSPDEVAHITLDAVEKNALYVATHPEWHALFEERRLRIRADFQQTGGQLDPLHNNQ